MPTFAGLAGAQYDTNGDNTTANIGNFTMPGQLQAVQGLPGSGAASNIGAFLGQRTCMPQFQGQVIFEKDLYGKAAFANRPRGFVADFGAGVQRIQYLGGQLNNVFTFGQGNFQQIGNRVLVQGTPRP